MRFEDERYVRVYTRDTVTWKLLPWEARTLLLHLFRKVDRAGLMDVGDDGIDGIAALVDLPIEVVAAGLAKLLERKTVRWIDSGQTLFVLNFTSAQEAHSSDAQRKRDQRERIVARAKLDGLGLVEDGPSRTVTDRPVEGQDVTGGHGESLRSVPIRAVEEPSALKPADGLSEPKQDPPVCVHCGSKDDHATEACRHINCTCEPETPANAKAHDITRQAEQGELIPELRDAALRQKNLGKKRRPLYDAAVAGTMLRLRSQYIAQRSRAKGQNRRGVEEACTRGEAHLKRAAEQVLFLDVSVERYLDVAFDMKPTKLSFPPLQHLAGPLMLDKVPGWKSPEERYQSSEDFDPSMIPVPLTAAELAAIADDPTPSEVIGEPLEVTWAKMDAYRQGKALDKSNAEIREMIAAAVADLTGGNE